MEKIIWGVKEKTLKDHVFVRRAQQGFRKGTSHLTKLCLYDMGTHLAGEGEAAGVAFLEGGWAFEAVPHSILSEKSCYGEPHMACSVQGRADGGGPSLVVLRGAGSVRSVDP